MARATDEQVQQYSDQRVRPRSEQMRGLMASIDDDKAAIDDVYEHLTDNPTWADDRGDAPPHLLTPGDVLAWNTFISGLQKFRDGTFADVTEANSFAAQWAIVQKACVRPIEVT